MLVERAGKTKKHPGPGGGRGVVSSMVQYMLHPCRTQPMGRTVLSTIKCSFGELLLLVGVGAPNAACAHASGGIVIDETAVGSSSHQGRIAVNNVAQPVDRVGRSGLHVRPKRIGLDAQDAIRIGLGGKRIPAKRSSADEVRQLV